MPELDGAGARLDGADERLDGAGERLVAAVERAIVVLDVLADSSGDLGTNEIARRAGINASSVSRLLATLARNELVRRVPDSGRYRLGLRLVQLGNAALARIDLREVARAHLLALMERTGETSTLSVPGEQATMTVDVVPSPSSVRSVAVLGRPGVSHATATGKVYLAHGGTLPGGPLPALTERTITDRAALADEVARVRLRGWAEAVSERERDLAAVAVPVLDGRGELVAVLGLQGPAPRFDRGAMHAGVELLREHATALAAELGR